MKKMLAQVLQKPGGPENLKLIEIPVPELTAGHVLIRIAATSVNPIDVKIRQGLPIGPVLPSPIGCDMAGTVMAAGAGVSQFKPGDEVFGCVAGVKGLSGTLAQFVLADAQLLARKPRSLSMREAAALPLVGITACLALRRLGLSAGEQILIQGANGGVGHIAVQLARVMGATVAASVRTQAAARQVRELGAQHVLPASEADRAQAINDITGGAGFAAVFDTVGGASLDAALAAAAPHGRVAAIAARSTHDLSPMHGKGLTLHMVFMLLPLLTGIGRADYGQILNQLAAWVDAGTLRPTVDPTHFELASAGAAQDHLASGQARGKVVINVTQPDIS